MGSVIIEHFVKDHLVRFFPIYIYPYVYVGVESVDWGDWEYSVTWTLNFLMYFNKFNLIIIPNIL